MVGVKCTMHIKELPGKKVATAFLVDKHPEYNSMTLTTEDVDNYVDLAMFGGKATIKYSRTAKGYTSVVTTEKMGKWEYEEEYSEQGFKNVSYTSYICQVSPKYIVILFLYIGSQKGWKMHD